MKVPIYRLPDAVATCDLLDGPAQGQGLGVHEISAAGVRLHCESSVPVLTYMDCRLRLETGVLPLFACALGAHRGILRLRWLHFDKGELQLFLDRLAATMNSSWQQGEVELPEPRLAASGDADSTPPPEPPTTLPLDPGVEQLVKELSAGRPLDPHLLNNLRNLLGRVLQADRSAAAGDPYDQGHVSLLERKVARLASSLEDAESLINRLRHEVSGGTAKGISTPVGPNLEDPAREAKSALLKALFQENLHLRDSLNAPRAT